MISVFRRRMLLAVSAVLLTLGALLSPASAEVITCATDGYVAMGGMVDNSANTYLLASDLNAPPSGEMQTWGYAYLTFDISSLLSGGTLPSAILTLTGGASGGMGTYPTVENPVDIGVLDASSLSSVTDAAAVHSALASLAPADTASVNGVDLAAYMWDITSIWNAAVLDDDGSLALVLASQGEALGSFYSLEGGHGATITTTAVPEPSTIALAVLALVGLGFSRILRRRPVVGGTV